MSEPDPIKIGIVPSNDPDGKPDGRYNVLYLAGDGHRPVMVLGFPSFEAAAKYSREMLLQTRDDVTWSPSGKPLTGPAS